MCILNSQAQGAAHSTQGLSCPFAQGGLDGKGSKEATKRFALRDQRDGQKEMVAQRLQRLTKRAASAVLAGQWDDRCLPLAGGPQDAGKFAILTVLRLGFQPPMRHELRHWRHQARSLATGPRPRQHPW